MKNRPEDTPKVIALSAAIITLFGIIVWQRLHAADSTPAVARTQPSPPLIARNAAGNPTGDVIPGQMRLLSDIELDNPLDQPTNEAAPGDAFRPLEQRAQHPLAARIGNPLSIPLPEMRGAITNRNALASHNQPNRHGSGFTVMLDGVLRDDVGIEAICSIHDPKISDPEASDRMTYLHVGDLLGGRRITAIDTPGIRLEAGDWWPIGQQQNFFDASVVFRTPPRATRAEQRKTQIANAAGVPRPDQSTDSDGPLASPPEQPDDTDDAPTGH